MTTANEQNARSPLTDEAYIKALSGANGNLAHGADSFHRLNDGLTQMMDAFGSPDETDTFDASCNTCRNFQRIPFDRKERLVSAEGFPGTCALDGSKQTGWPRGQLCGKPCYVNRRTGATNAKPLIKVSDESEAARP